MKWSQVEPYADSIIDECCEHVNTLHRVMLPDRWRPPVPCVRHLTHKPSVIDPHQRSTPALIWAAHYQRVFRRSAKMNAAIEDRQAVIVFRLDGVIMETWACTELFHFSAMLLKVQQLTLHLKRDSHHISQIDVMLASVCYLSI